MTDNLAALDKAATEAEMRYMEAIARIDLTQQVTDAAIAAKDEWVDANDALHVALVNAYRSGELVERTQADAPEGRATCGECGAVWEWITTAGATARDQRTIHDLTAEVERLREQRRELLTEVTLNIGNCTPQIGGALGRYRDSVSMNDAANRAVASLDAFAAQCRTALAEEALT